MSDLLDSLNAGGGVDDKETVSLLDQMGEGSVKAFNPSPEDKGAGVEGELVAVGDQPDDYNPGKSVPIWTIRQADGSRVRVIGFRSVLRREMNESGAAEGDRVAVKYFGTDKVTKGAYAGKDFHNYGVAVAKANKG